MSAVLQNLTGKLGLDSPNHIGRLAVHPARRI